jgi:ketosteroid isomerase-like protein
MPPDFQEFERSILQSVVDKRWADLAELLHDDFVITTAGWLTEPASKQTWITEVAERHLLHGFDIHSIDVRDMGTVAVVLVLSTQRATWKDASFEGVFRYTDVWRTDESGGWRLAVRHASLLPTN